MANPRELDKRRKSIRNIRKITRTMELIATARFKKAMDRAAAATSYTQRITKVVADLAHAGLKVTHPLLEEHESTEHATLLVLSGNRGFCGGFNTNVNRAGLERWKRLSSEVPNCELELSGKRALAFFKNADFTPDRSYLHFEDKPRFDEVDELATRYLEAFELKQLDRLDVAYTRFVSAARQEVVIETLLPLGSLDAETDEAQGSADYEFLPSPEAILEEVVPTSFKVRLFKCFLDSAVSEQIARMVAMKSATENAGELINQLSREYNRARQGRITSELMDVIGGVEALK